jgi:anaerobic selenocysteine-containing dehydrogenase
MGFEPELFEVSDEELARQALEAPFGSRYPPASGFVDISLDRLRERGPLRLNLPMDYAPFAQGNFGTPSGKCELYSPALAERGLDPLPNYTPPAEDPQTRPDLAARYPLQMVCPPNSSFLNSSFVNIDACRRAAGEPTLELHPLDAALRGISSGQRVRVFNERGSFHARAIVGESVKKGVVVTLGIWWNKLVGEGKNCNTTVSTALTDFGAAATFFDNLVQVESA